MVLIDKTLTVTEMSKKYNIKRHTLAARIRAGMSIEEACTKPVIKRKSITVNDKTYSCLTAACKKYKICVKTVQYRLGQGWTLEEALNLEKREVTNKKSRKITINNKVFSSIRKACKFYKIDENIVKNRLHYKWPLEQAFGLIKRKTFIVANVDYGSLKNACSHFNVKRQVVSQRLLRNWTTEEAFGLVKRKFSKKCKGKLYVITNNINSKKYIGITTYSLTHRFKQHKASAKKGSNTKFHKAMRKHGIENFKIKLLRETDNRHNLVKLEIKYISKYNSIDKGYNTGVGGGSIGDKHGKHINYKGIEFISYKSLAEYLNISRTELWRRIKNNAL